MKPQMAFSSSFAALSDILLVSLTEEVLTTLMRKSVTNAKSLNMYKVFLVVLIKIVSKFIINTILVKIHK